MLRKLKECEWQDENDSRCDSSPDVCSEYPCKQIKNLEKSYRTRYAASLMENSQFVKENGMAVFMEQQKKRYTCPECGGIISIHDWECSECRFQVKKESENTV